MSSIGWVNDRARKVSRIAVLLSIGGLLAALLAAAGSGMDAFTFRTGFVILRYAFYAAIAGGLLSIVAFVMARRSETRVGRANLFAFIVAALFVSYLSVHIVNARRAPAIHDVATDLVDLPQYTALRVRDDNLDNIPDNGRPELVRLSPVDRWKVLHGEAYGDLRALRLPVSRDEAMSRVEAQVRERGWDIARVDRRAGIVEATATSRFFRFKDDIVVRVRDDRERSGGSVIDMRSISRVGGSDIGVNAARIRRFLADLKADQGA